MKVVILAGGYGTRISEETHLKPKPMVEIGGMPILWHIMKAYGHYGLTEFVICCGYKGYLIKEYFSNYFLHMSDVTIDIGEGSMEVHQKYAEPWRVTLVDTGQGTQTGGRLKRVADYIDGPFCMTYGDGVSDVDFGALIDYFNERQTKAVVTGVQPRGRFGSLDVEGDLVTGFEEKPAGDHRWINGGFFVLDPSVIDLVDGDDTVWELAPLQKLSEDGQLSVYRHYGFWAAMDTLRDKETLEKLWAEQKAPWRVWG
jgi:glucose-1-phosphate cytidylyltransferase